MDMNIASALRVIATTHRVSFAEHYTDGGRLLYVLGDKVLTPEQAERFIAAATR